MFKKLLFIVSLLYSALFHSSAEVDYLKVKAEISSGASIGERITLQKAEGAVATDGNVVYYEEVSGNGKTEKRIVIYLPSSFVGDRVEEAKKQFENILNSGLIKDGNFDLTYVDVPAGWDKNRQMPGIAARIDNSIQKKDGKNIETFPVLCATKRKNEFHGFFAHEYGWKRSLGILANEDDYQYNFYKKQMPISESPGYIAVEYGFFLSDIEHTERQLFYSMLHNNAILKNSTEIALIGQKSNDEFWDILEVNDCFANNDDEPIAPEFGFYHNSTFFVWTKGNPCISHRGWHDNGGICCTEWYKNVIYPALTKEGSKLYGSKVFLYFNDCGLNDATQSVIDAVWAHTGITESKPGKLILSSRVTGDTTDDLAQLVKCYKVKKTVKSGGHVKTVSEGSETETVEYSFAKDSKDELEKQTSLSSPHIPNLIVGQNAYIITKYNRAAIINRLNQWTNWNAKSDNWQIEYINHYN